MFGQTAGIGQTTISNKSDLSSSPIQNKSIDTNKVKEKKIIKIENFTKENTNNNKTKIKIKTF